MKFPMRELALTCDQLFHKWCADEMVDPRLYDILEEAFANGFMARDALDHAIKLCGQILPRPVPGEVVKFCVRNSEHEGAHRAENGEVWARIPPPSKGPTA